MEKYITEKRVLAALEISKDEQKTPGGNEFVLVSFEDGTKEVMPKMRFEMIVTDKISNATQVQETIKAKVAANIFGMLHEFGIKFGEIDGIMDAVVNLANSGFHKSQDILFGFNQPNIPLNNINKILVEDYVKNNSNVAGSTGSGSDK